MSARSGGTLVRAHANAGVVLSGIAGRRALLDQGLDLGLLVAAVAAQRADAGQLPGLSPARDRLRVALEAGRDPRRGEPELVGHCGAFRVGGARPPRWGRGGLCQSWPFERRAWLCES